MSSLFGLEASRAAQFAIAFAIILVLVALFGLVLRKLTGARLMMPGNDRGRSRQPRLGIVDVYDLDRQRQLLLLRRDNVEHLLLIGGPNDVVIETNIVRAAGARLPPAANETAPERFEPSLEQPPRAPQVEQPGRPSIETQLAAQLGSFIRRPADSDANQELSPVASVSAPIPAHSEPVLKPDAVTVSTAPSMHRLRTEASLPASPEPSAAPEPAVRPELRPAFTPPPPPFQSRPTPTPPGPPVPPVPAAPPAPPPPSPQPEIVRPPQSALVERANPDAAVLSDMAKQLEEALKRPASPVSPPPAALASVTKPVVHEDISDEDDLLEPRQDNEEVEAPKVESLEDRDRVGAPAARAPEPPRPVAGPVRPAPPPQPAADAAKAADTSAAPPSQKAMDQKAPDQKEADPFSVEDIEAEFARLLGRPLDPGKKS